MSIEECQSYLASARILEGAYGDDCRHEGDDSEVRPLGAVTAIEGLANRLYPEHYGQSNHRSAAMPSFLERRIAGTAPTRTLRSETVLATLLS